MRRFRQPRRVLFLVCRLYSKAPAQREVSRHKLIRIENENENEKRNVSGNWRRNVSGNRGKRTIKTEAKAEFLCLWVASVAKCVSLVVTPQDSC